MQWVLISTAIQSIRGKHDGFGYTSAAFLSGALFKSTAGQRQAVITGGICAGVVGTFQIINYFSKRRYFPSSVGVEIRHNQPA